ncbi:MAG: hypothetical protein ACI9N9_000610 [Enterobacterales bacterium]|jgi:hypothetical protein
MCSPLNKFRADVCKLQSTLNPSELKNIYPEEVDSLGGIELFTKLGIEVDLMTFYESVK